MDAQPTDTATTSSGGTLLFCTSYVRDAQRWTARHRRWLDFHGAVPLTRTATFVIDDASPFVPDEHDIAVLDALPPVLPDGYSTFFYRFAAHEGRIGLTGHRGWWRSFLFSLDIAETYGYDKIVHVESDAYVLSRALVDYLNGLASGWTALWCPRYNFPEPALQAIHRDQFPALRAVAARGLDTLTRQLAELVLPFTHIERRLAGNRYGEWRRRIPGYADYACQVNATMDVRYRP